VAAVAHGGKPGLPNKPGLLNKPWAVAKAGLLLSVRLTPKGGRPAIDGIADLADGTCVLKVRVRAAASEGEANAALVNLMARTLRVAARNVSLLAGGRARIKRLQISGEGAARAAALERICEG